MSDKANHTAQSTHIKKLDATELTKLVNSCVGSFVLDEQLDSSHLLRAEEFAHFERSHKVLVGSLVAFVALGRTPGLHNLNGGAFGELLGS